MSGVTGEARHARNLCREVASPTRPLVVSHSVMDFAESTNFLTLKYHSESSPILDATRDGSLVRLRSIGTPPFSTPRLDAPSRASRAGAPSKQPPAWSKFSGQNYILGCMDLGLPREAGHHPGITSESP